MAPLRFRAWHKDHGYMLPTRLTGGRNHPFTEENVVSNIYAVNCNGKDNITYFGVNQDGIIIEQSTGLKDGQGVEVFEGDILQWLDYLPKQGVVSFDYASFGIDGGEALFGIFENYSCIEVIGNIHENPELLEDKQ